MPERKPFYRSKKWWTAFIGAAIPVVNHLAGWNLSAEELLAVVLPLIAYIMGEAIADAAGAKKAA